MLRDGVCDELTNTELCFYDGGDCCLDREKKDNTLCKTCTCKVSVDDAKLRDTFKTTQVMKIEKPEDFQRLILRTEKTVNDVLKLEVCSAMCTEFTDTVNGWRYNGMTSTCTCSWLRSTECFNDELPLKEVGFFDETDVFAQASITSYIQLSKILNCSNLPLILLSFLVLFIS